MSELATLPVRPVTLLDAQTPDEVVTHAQHVADTLAAVIKKQKLAVTIGGRPYVRVEGWTLLGAMLGVSQNTVWSRKIDDGWEARVEAFSRDGRLLGSGEAMCTRAEKSWAKRDEYAIRSMAQTRAVSKALRQPLGFVISLAGYEATPAEPVMEDDPAFASEGQVKNIWRLVNKIEKAGKATRGQLLEAMGQRNGTERPSELSRTQAQMVITDLKELAGET